MKDLKQQFKQILERKCLTNEEKKYLKKIFKDFISSRKIIERKTVQLIDENEFGQDYQLDSIIGGSQSSYFSNFD